MSILTRKPDLDTCPICYDPFFEDGAKVRAIVGLNCEHHFHAGCIAAYVYKRTETDGTPPCPTCRAPIFGDVQAVIKTTDHKEEFEEVVGDVTNVYVGVCRTLARREGPVWTENYMGLKGFERKVSFVVRGGDTTRFTGERGCEFKSTVECANGDLQFYRGRKDMETLVRIKFSNGIDCRYEGPRGEEYLVQRTLQNGDVERYGGEKGTERKIKVCCANGDTQFFEGSANLEYLRRLKTASGDNYFYCGQRGAEYKSRVERACGDSELYVGARSNEKLHKITRANGDTESYSGDRGKEFLRYKTLANGDVEMYKGCRGNEALTKKSLKKGDSLYFDGGAGNEYMVKKYVAKDGTTYRYRGSVRDSEELASIEYPDARVEHFIKGPGGIGQHCRTEYLDGRQEFFEHEKGKKRLVCKKEIVLQACVKVTHICKNGKERHQKNTERPLPSSLDSRAKRMRIAEKFVGPEESSE